VPGPRHRQEDKEDIGPWPLPRDGAVMRAYNEPHADHPHRSRRDGQRGASDNVDAGLTLSRGAALAPDLLGSAWSPRQNSGRCTRAVIRCPWRTC
jgi:hypothetical protein